MRLGTLALAALLGAAASAQGATCTSADYVLKAQRIYTANDAQWTAERVAVKATASSSWAPPETPSRALRGHGGHRSQTP
jgi:hypothetical protein